MNIRVNYVNKTSEYFGGIKNYDFYPETKILFADRNDESIYIPIGDNVKSLIIKDGNERGYLEGRNEAR